MILDLQFRWWYSENDLFVNLRNRIEKVAYLQHLETVSCRYRQILDASNYAHALKVGTAKLGDSLLSLLVRLHNRMAESDYRPPPSFPSSSEAGDTDAESASYGDGPHAIRRLLNRVCALDEACRTELESICNTLYACRSASSESMHLVKKKQMAKERQKRVMAQFAAKQQAVMSHYLKTVGSSSQTASSSSVSTDVMTGDRLSDYDTDVYECVICSQADSSCPKRPICLVASAQSTNIFKKCTLPPNFGFDTVLLRDAEKSRGSLDHFWHMKKEEKFKYSNLSCTDEYCFLDTESVFIQCCGHFVHKDCLDAYRDTLRSDQRPRHTTVLEVSHGEFLCPLCRQISNFCMPVLSAIEDRPCTFDDHSNDAMFSDLPSLLTCSVYEEIEDDIVPTSRTIMLGCMKRFNENVPYYQQSQCGFFCNLIRMNLALMAEFKEKLEKRNLHCTSLLLRFVSRLIQFYHSARAPFNVDEQMFLLTGLPSRAACTWQILQEQKRPFPLLMVDMELALVHASVLFMQNSKCERHFRALCQAFWNPLVVQICLGELCRLGVGLKVPTPSSKQNVVRCGSVTELMRYLLCFDMNNCTRLELFNTVTCTEKEEEEFMDSIVQSICVRSMEFLRIAALLKCLITGTSLPDRNLDDFQTLKRFCLLRDGERDLTLHSEYGPSAIERWFVQLTQLRASHPIKSLVRMFNDLPPGMGLFGSALSTPSGRRMFKYV
ncbi:unnamed protein product [Soboliphyme baturini]|uniref:E3 ubiquitin-protein ligase n=1 Tax=Soboliphyme baturini TaxID=241478 RepID=A0A183IVL3_9BILA|nr:unnamed protein product [Soboliphyme baturini]